MDVPALEGTTGCDDCLVESFHMMNRFWIAAIGLAVVGAGVAWLVAAPDDQHGVLPYRDATAVAEGKDIYVAQCASCHGLRLQGEPNWREPDGDGYLPAPPHDESGHIWHHPDEQLIAITALGTARLVGNGYKSKMPGFGNILSPDEIAAVLAYVKSTWPHAIQERHDKINATAG